jgi:hypothetical protein
MVSQGKISADGKNGKDRSAVIDFTDLPKKNKAYSGANGSKISVVYNGEIYMLKFPSPPTKNTEMSYTNSCISEYIGCRIFESAGIPVQEVLLGKYNVNGKEKTVVACKDFAVNGLVFQDFASLKNQVVDSERNGYGTELDDIIAAFDYQTAIDRDALSERFWDMFIIDALIGNWDRHNGNWGFLYNSVTDEITLAPVFDCGSSLFPQADSETVMSVINDKNALNDRVFNRPTSAIVKGGTRLNYFKFISSHENADCDNALKRIIGRIDMDKINAIVDDAPFTDENYKLFLKTIISARKERILDFSYKGL